MLQEYIVLQPLGLLQTSEIPLKFTLSHGTRCLQVAWGTLIDPKPMSPPVFPCALVGLSLTGFKSF